MAKQIHTEMATARMLEAIVAIREDRALAALEEGAKPDGKDRFGRPALVWAAERGMDRLAEKLLEAGADAAASDRQGWGALHFAAREGNLKLAKRLLAAGAPPDEPDSWGCTALMLAAGNGHREIALELLGRGASARRDSEGETPGTFARDGGFGDLAREIESYEARMESEKLESVSGRAPAAKPKAGL